MRKLAGWQLVFLLTIGVGVAAGLWHWKTAERALFLFRNDEPLASWIVLVSGPGLTLPATGVALFSRSAGGYLLVGGGIVSLVAFATLVEDVVQMMNFLWMQTGPMLLLGGSLLWAARQGPLFPKHEDQRPSP